MNKFILFFALCFQCTQSRTPSISVDAGAPDVSQSPEAGVVDADLDVQVDAPPAHQNILLIGDSEVRYVHWYFDPMRKPNETVYFDSKPGTTIGWWNDNFKREMSKYHDIDVVIIFLGTNNFNFTYLQPHQNILDTLNASSAKCIWVGPTDVHMEKFTNFHKTGKLIQQEFSPRCTYVDTEQLGIQLEDGVHPSQKGAVKWLQEIWKVKDSL